MAGYTQEEALYAAAGKSQAEIEELRRRRQAEAAEKTAAVVATRDQMQADAAAKTKAVIDAHAADVRGDNAANFTLSQGAQSKRAAADAEMQALTNARLARPEGQQYSTPDELMAFNAAAARKVDAASEDQATRGGVEVADSMANAGGIAGFFGGKEVTKHYTAGRTADTTTEANKAAIGARIAQIEGRQATQAQAAGLDQGLANQMRARQVGLADALTASAMGTGGPSAAEGTLQLGMNQSMDQAAALAKSGRGNQAAALKAAMSQGANIAANAGAQASVLRAQEQQAARGQLAGVLDASRGQDLGAATTNAGMQQQTNLANMQARIDQQKDADAQIAALMQTGMSLDQARRQYELQQAQFNAELLARQAAADKGVAMQSSAAGGQALASTVGAVATGIASAASDKRVKKKITDGEDESRKFLKALKPHGFEYKDPAAHGKGHHLGVMAQDVETEAPDLVIDDSDGVKKIDIRKALSASLATLGSIGRRLDKLEGGRGKAKVS